MDTDNFIIAVYKDHHGIKIDCDLDISPMIDSTVYHDAPNSVYFHLTLDELEELIKKLRWAKEAYVDFLKGE